MRHSHAYARRGGEQPGDKPEVRPDPVHFLSAQQRALYGDVITEALEQYPPGSTDQAAFRLLTPCYKGRVPPMIVRAKLRSWIVNGEYTHEKCVAAFVITAMQSQVGNPFAYAEAIMRGWQSQTGKVMRLAASRRNRPEPPRPTPPGDPDAPKGPDGPPPTPPPTPDPIADAETVRRAMADFDEYRRAALRGERLPEDDGEKP